MPHDIEPVILPFLIYGTFVDPHIAYGVTEKTFRTSGFDVCISDFLISSNEFW